LRERGLACELNLATAEIAATPLSSGSHRWLIEEISKHHASPVNVVADNCRDEQIGLKQRFGWWTGQFGPKYREVQPCQQTAKMAFCDKTLELIWRCGLETSELSLQAVQFTWAISLT
jgi:hypothetical protein